jgi:Protein of unknown function (DUF1559)
MGCLGITGIITGGIQTMKASNLFRFLAMLALATISAGAAAAATIALDANGAQDVSNLLQIALALHNYQDVFGRFPAEYIGPVGTPLLSWRVAILPYLGQGALYSQFDLSKPWDDPANLALLAQMPAVFREPTDAIGSTHAGYVVGVDTNTMFPGSPGVTLASTIDGTSNTILVGESSGSAIPWTKPEDVAIGSCPTLGGSGFSSSVAGAVPFAFVDGSVKFLPNSIGCDALRGLLLRNDGITDTSMALDYVIATVPEPSSLPLFGFFLSAVALCRFRNRR